MPFEERFLRVPPPIELAGRHVKRYHVNVHDAEIEIDVETAAYDIVPELFPEPDDTPPASFVVLHRGLSAAYVLAYNWVWDNVLHCQTAAAGVPFLGCPDTDATNFVRLHRPWIGCVWELPPLCHERSAWVRHMLAADPPDLCAYLADTMQEGTIGASGFDH